MSAAPAGPGEDLRVLLWLSLPLAGSQLGMMMLRVVEALVAGRAGTDVLAAVSLGNIWIHGTMLVATGVVLGVDPIISQAHGAGDGRAAALALQRGVVLSLLLAVPLGVLWLWTAPVLVAFGQDPRLSAMAGKFVAVQAPTAVGFLIFTVNRQYLAGRNIVAPSVWVVVVTNALNLVLCWALVFGRLGAPAMGIVGAGIAGAVTQAFLAAALWTLTFRLRLHEEAWVPWSRAALDLRAIGRIALIGVPIGLHLGLEVWAFQIATLMAGRLGTVALGAHTIVLNMAALAFMLPLGISMGASVRVGNLIGAGERLRARRNAFLSVALGTAAMGISAVAFAVYRREIPALYGVAGPVALAAAAILPIAAAFQLFDGLQVVGIGVLRGVGKTRPAAVFNLLGYYALALPLAWWLAFERGWGLAGIWWGLAAGLAAVAGALVVYLARPSLFAGAARVG